MLREDALALLRNGNYEDGGVCGGSCRRRISLFRLHPALTAAPPALVRSMGSSIESWPHWANDAPGSHYLTK
jgi:hypothetical protein